MVKWVHRNWLYVFLLGLALGVYALAGGPITHYIGRHDIKVLLILLGMMLITGGAASAGVIEHMSYWFLDRIKGTRAATITLILLTSVLSAFVTNDITLFVMVPLTINIFSSTGISPMWPVILITVAANVGSSLTPVGNPQNIYIYAYYHLSPVAFVKAIYPFTLIGTILLVLSATILVKDQGMIPKAKPPAIKPYGWINVAIFPLFLYATFKDSIPLLTAIVVILLIMATIWKGMRMAVDWKLLIIFLAFFFISGGITKLYNPTPLNNPKLVLVSSALLSQIISNVPAATIMADITPLWKPLLIGVSVGGIGTLISSMANLIGYRLYTRERRDSYLLWFHIYSGILFIIMLISMLPIIR